MSGLSFNLLTKGLPPLKTFLQGCHILVTDGAARPLTQEASVAGVLYNSLGSMMDSWVMKVPFRTNTNGIEAQAITFFASEATQKYKEIHHLLVLSDSKAAVKFLNKVLTNSGEDAVMKTEENGGALYLAVADELRSVLHGFQISYAFSEYTGAAHNLAAMVLGGGDKKFKVRYPGEGSDLCKTIVGSKSGQFQWSVMKEKKFWDGVKNQEQWENSEFLKMMTAAPMTTFAQASVAIAEGNELLEDGKYMEAILRYQDALQLAPQGNELRSISHSNIAACFIKLEKYDEAAKECSKALELYPVYINALFLRGVAYEKLERYDEAISDMRKILESEPSNVQARRNIVRLEQIARIKMK